MMRKEKKYPSTCIKISLFYLILGSMILFQLGQPSPGWSTQSPDGNSKLVPAFLLRWPEEGSPYAVLVDKSKQRVLVYHRENPFEPLKIYPASTGENAGPKKKINDRKTPEGIYFFTGSFEDNELAPIYGVRAFPIDYPNPIDKKEGRGGYGIWVHGLDKPLKPTDTNGCIALDNPNINDLASYIKLDDTPIVISQQVRLVDYEEMKKEAQELEQIIEDLENSLGRQRD